MQKKLSDARVRKLFFWINVGFENKIFLSDLCFCQKNYPYFQAITIKIKPCKSWNQIEN